MPISISLRRHYPDQVQRVGLTASQLPCGSTPFEKAAEWSYRAVASIVAGRYICCDLTAASDPGVTDNRPRQ